MGGERCATLRPPSMRDNGETSRSERSRGETPRGGTASNWRKYTQFMNSRAGHIPHVARFTPAHFCVLFARNYNFVTRESEWQINGVVNHVAYVSKLAPITHGCTTAHGNLRRIPPVGIKATCAHLERREHIRKRKYAYAKKIEPPVKKNFSTDRKEIRLL